MGDIEQNIIRQCKQTNEPLPERIKNKPRLWSGLDLYYNAFFELDSERNVGMALMPIPTSAIHNYCLRNEIVGEMAEDMLEFTRALDNTFMRLVAPK